MRVKKAGRWVTIQLQRSVIGQPNYLFVYMCMRMFTHTCTQTRIPLYISFYILTSFQPVAANFSYVQLNCFFLSLFSFTYVGTNAFRRRVTRGTHHHRARGKHLHRLGRRDGFPHCACVRDCRSVPTPSASECFLFPFISILLQHSRTPCISPVVPPFFPSSLVSSLHRGTCMCVCVHA